MKRKFLILIFLKNINRVLEAALNIIMVNLKSKEHNYESTLTF